MKESHISINPLTVLVPIFNEAASLPRFLPGLISICGQKGWNVILVDDCSTDDTYPILEGYQAYPFVKIIHHKVNQGYGGALKSGMLSVITPYVITIDGDGQHDVNEIEELFEFALQKDADLVVGNRGRSGNSNIYRSFGKWVIRNFTRLLMPLPIRDINSGFKLYRTELAKCYIPLCPNSMAFSDVMTLIFVNQRNLVLEYPITIKERMSGKSTISTRTAFETVMEILNIVMMFNPLKIFLPISVLCFIFGIGWGIPILMMKRGVSVGAMLAIVLGAIFFAIGLIASQLSAIRTENLEKGSNERKHDGQETI